MLRVSIVFLLALKMIFTADVSAQLLTDSLLRELDLNVPGTEAAIIVDHVLWSHLAKAEWTETGLDAIDCVDVLVELRGDCEEAGVSESRIRDRVENKLRQNDIRIADTAITHSCLRELSELQPQLLELEVSTSYSPLYDSIRQLYNEVNEREQMYTAKGTIVISVIASVGPPPLEVAPAHIQAIIGRKVYLAQEFRRAPQQTYALLPGGPGMLITGTRVSIKDKILDAIDEMVESLINQIGRANSN